MSQQQTCVITGNAGFIGSNLSDFLLNKGLRVIGIDNLITGSAENLTDALKHPMFSFIQQDVIEPITIDEPVHYIFHLASPASVIDYQKFPEETALVNSAGTRNMLILAKEKNARILFASTSEVYGDPKEHPQKETYWGNVNPNGIRSCYDESKRFGEMLMSVYARKFNINTRTIRIFNTYGPRMRPTDGRVISNFINQMLQGKPITIYGDGTQTRSFCYVSDLVEGIWSVMNAENLKGEVVNLGNPEEYSMLELAEKIQKKLQITGNIVYQDLPTDDPVVRKPDITKVQQSTGWSPRVQLEDGLIKTIEYYKSISK